MPVCVFPNCDSGSRKKGIQSNPNVHLHRFPKNEDIRNKWLMQIGSNIDGKCINLNSVQDGLRYQTYVDDICLGADTEELLSKLQSELKAVLGRSALELKKWSSNSRRVLLDVAAADRVSDVINFDDKEGGTTKVLGLRWEPVKDVFGFDVRPVTKVITKRSVLSTIATIFDPIGFLAPVIFHAKHIMQLNWDGMIRYQTT
ncbi:uncharacterized protein LOC103309127 [Acyrthosiphon pisum]|uniref:THAP-type domain-containing protein n=1 Tax=Acyrthosiphon pisum TaxID=7029 RepID=A0A8R2NQQ7_ACYPI|nr:uncharacterized protein LOC103309127 [Acyrthosiphon pisum]